MKKIFKKNQIIITALALLIAIAGYINYKDNITKPSTIKSFDNKLPVTETVADMDEIISNDVDPDMSITDDTDYYDVLNPGEAIFTSGNGFVESDMIISAKLKREQVRANNKNTLLEIINNDALSAENKDAAIAQMISMTDVAEREALCETLLESKGFSDCIVSICDESADVVINVAELSDTQRVQIEDIVKRKAGIAASNITILSVAN